MVSLQFEKPSMQVTMEFVTAKIIARASFSI